MVLQTIVNPALLFENLDQEWTSASQYPPRREGYVYFELTTFVKRGVQQYGVPIQNYSLSVSQYYTPRFCVFYKTKR